MDAMAVLGVVANALQLAEIGGRLTGSATVFAKAREDTSREATHVEQVTSDLRNIAEVSKSPCQSRNNLFRKLRPKQPGEDDLAISALAKDTKELADELLSLLNTIKRRPGRNKTTEGFRQSIVALWKEKEFQSYRQRLAEFQSQLNLRLTRITT